MPVTEARGGEDRGALVSSRPVHDGRIVRLSVDTVRFPDGSTGELEMIRHSGAAAVVPLWQEEGPEPDILLVRQYRYAAGGDLLEIPAGRPDGPDEPWEACARRELEEETGFRAGRLSWLTTIYTTPGFTDERIRIYLGTGLETGTARRDPDEFLEPVRMPLSEAVARVASGEICDAKTVCGILQAAHRVDRSREPT